MAEAARAAPLSDEDGETPSPRGFNDDPNEETPVVRWHRLAASAQALWEISLRAERWLKTTAAQAACLTTVRSYMFGAPASAEIADGQVDEDAPAPDGGAQEQDAAGANSRLH